MARKHPPKCILPWVWGSEGRGTGLACPPRTKTLGVPLGLGFLSSSVVAPTSPRHHRGQGIRTADFSKTLLKAAATPAVFLQSKQNMTLVNSIGLLKL